ncbi:WecB/TagA/CpsF family glycosyltransferase [Pseudomonas vancouverensis]|uniref:WecB/TagA/CpsF family glycosyltransferase n=1 Tax=Pseudomonas vancouverensis TaxID=95300 RepID=UPI003D037308
MNQVNSILGIKISTLNLEETVRFIFESINDGNIILREDLNAFKLSLMKSGSPIAKAFDRSTFINADGASIVLAHRLLFNRRIPRVTGCDLMPALVKKCAEQKKTIFLLGATQAVVESLALNIEAEFGPDIIAGYRNGFFGENDWHEITKQINACQADFLFIGTPSPQKENFIISNIDSLTSTQFVMGVGGTFDVLTGITRRAPNWVQRAGMEWLYRVIQEPRRMWKRYLVCNSKFLILLIKEKLKQFTSPKQQTQ